jgi:hypothetical protein
MCFSFVSATPTVSQADIFVISLEKSFIKCGANE